MKALDRKLLRELKASKGLLLAITTILAVGVAGYVELNSIYANLIDAQRTLLDVRLLIVESKAEREKRLAEIEALAGIDVETLTGEALRLDANGQLHQTPAADTN